MSNRILNGLNGGLLQTGDRWGSIDSFQKDASSTNHHDIQNLFRDFAGSWSPSSRYDFRNESTAEKILISKGIVRDPEVARLLDRNKHMMHDVYLHSNSAGPTRSYAFFVRTNLNLFKADSSGGSNLGGLLSRLQTQKSGKGLEGVSLNPDLEKYPLLLSAVTLNAELSLELCRDACGGSGLIPILANHCSEIAPVNIQSDDRDGVRNMYGKSMQLPGVFNFYDNQISVTFNDNRYGDISKLFYLLGIYKDHVVREGFKRADKYIARNAIDWATSIYVMTVDADNYIIGWVKYTGCVPKTLPLNLAQHKKEGFAEGELTSDVVIDFQVFKTNPYKISTLAEFNKISGFNVSTMLPLRCPIDQEPEPVTGDLNLLYEDAISKQDRGKFTEATIPNISRRAFANRTKNTRYTQMAKTPGVIYDSEERRYRLVFSN